MLLLNSFDPYTDFWESNPQAKILFANYTSLPSSHMWAALLFAHPESKLFNESPSSRRTLIAQDYLKDPSFSWDQLTPLIEDIKRLTLTKAQQLYLNWEKRMYEREAFMDSVSYSPDTYQMKEQMAKETPKLWQSFFQIQELLEKEKSSHTEGDIEESLSEKNVI